MSERPQRLEKAIINGGDDKYHENASRKGASVTNDIKFFKNSLCEELTDVSQVQARYAEVLHEYGEEEADAWKTEYLATLEDDERSAFQSEVELFTPKPEKMSDHVSVDKDKSSARTGPSNAGQEALSQIKKNLGM